MAAMIERGDLQRKLASRRALARDAKFRHVLSCCTDFAPFRMLDVLGEGCCGIVFLCTTRVPAWCVNDAEAEDDDDLDDAAAAAADADASASHGARVGQTVDVPVAVKVVAGVENPRNTTLRRAFQNEYRTLCMLPPHPHVVPLFAHFVKTLPADMHARLSEGMKVLVGRASAPVLAMVMPRFPLSLKAALEADPPPLCEHKVRWCLEVASAVAHLWRHRWVHLDLKLDNVLVEPSGRALLSDFGTALQLDEDGRTLSVQLQAPPMGNQASRAPEVVEAWRLAEQEHGHTNRSFVVKLDAGLQEVWALGVLMHEALAGVHPCGHEYPTEGADREPVVETRLMLERGVPGEVVEVLQRMLQRSPAARLADPLQAYRALSAAWRRASSAAGASARGDGLLGPRDVAGERALLADQLALDTMMHGVFRNDVARHLVEAGILLSHRRGTGPKVLLEAELAFIRRLIEQHASPALAQQLVLQDAVAGCEWRLGEHFELVEDAPRNRRPDGSMEGVCSLVYRIRHARAARPLVLKVMISFRQDVSLDGVTTRGMLTALVKLHSAEFLLPQLAPHLHVVRVLHHFVGDMAPFAAHVHEALRPHLTKQTVCVVMPEFGSSLQRVSEEVAAHGVGWVGEAKAVKVLLQLLLAVRHLQAYCVAHCDIKPDNVLLDAGTWHAVLSGFGMARKLVSPKGKPTPVANPYQLSGGNLLTRAPEVKRLLMLDMRHLADEEVTMAEAFRKAGEFACGATLLLTLLGDNGKAFGDTGEAGWRAPALPGDKYSAGFRAVLNQLLAVDPDQRLDASSAVLMLGVLLWRRDLVPAAGVAGAGDGLAGEHEDVDTVLQLQWLQVAQATACEQRRGSSELEVLEELAERLSVLVIDAAAD